MYNRDYSPFPVYLTCDIKSPVYAEFLIWIVPWKTLRKEVLEGEEERKVYHYRDYIKIIRMAVRHMKENGFDDPIVIGAIDKYIQSNFLIEMSQGADLSEFSQGC